MTERIRQVPSARTYWLTTGIGVLLLLVPAGFFAAVPGELADRRAYATAPACPDGTRADECAATVPAVVEGKENVSAGRGVRHYLLLTEQGGGTVLRERMDGRKPVFEAVRAGDEVSVTYWRGEIRTVRFGDAVQDTRASPADDWRMPLAIGLASLPLGPMVAWTAWWYRYRYPVAKLTGMWWVGGVWLAGIVQGGVGLLAGGAGGGVPEAFLLSAGGLFPSAVLGGLFTWWLRWRGKRAADTSGIVPVPVKKRRCVRATVDGDVPYSVRDFGYLAVGDGRPAATPDPAGRAARRMLPETLTVERVRAFGLDDPPGWMEGYKHNGIVIECLDGDRSVHIATRRRDAPLVLGALVTPAVPSFGPGERR